MKDAIRTQLSPTVRTLPNGLTVVMEHLPYVHSVSVGVWIKTGSADYAVVLDLLIGELAAG